MKTIMIQSLMITAKYLRKISKVNQHRVLILPASTRVREVVDLFLCQGASAASHNSKTANCFRNSYRKNKHKSL